MHNIKNPHSEEQGVGADDGIRTHDRLITNQLLYQLSHISVLKYYINNKYLSQDFLICIELP